MGRVYSGAINHSESVYAIGAAKPERVQQVAMMVEVTASPYPRSSQATSPLVTGIRSAAAGVTLCDKDFTFKAIRHYLTRPSPLPLNRRA